MFHVKDRSAQNITGHQIGRELYSTKVGFEGFGEQFLQHVIPAFFDNDANGILQRAKITKNGKLTKRFSYLQDYLDGI